MNSSLPAIATVFRLIYPHSSSQLSSTLKKRHPISHRKIRLSSIRQNDCFRTHPAVVLPRSTFISRTLSEGTCSKRKSAARVQPLSRYFAWLPLFSAYYGNGEHQLLRSQDDNGEAAKTIIQSPRCNIYVMEPSLKMIWWRNRQPSKKETVSDQSHEDTGGKSKVPTAEPSKLK